MEIGRIGDGLLERRGMGERDAGEEEEMGVGMGISEHGMIGNGKEERKRL